MKKSGRISGSMIASLRMRLQSWSAEISSKDTPSCRTIIFCSMASTNFSSPGRPVYRFTAPCALARGSSGGNSVEDDGLAEDEGGKKCRTDFPVPGVESTREDDSCCLLESCLLDNCRLGGWGVAVEELGTLSPYDKVRLGGELGSAGEELMEGKCLFVFNDGGAGPEKTAYDSCELHYKREYIDLFD